MRKIMKLVAIASLASLTSMQVVACKDNSKYDGFISDVNNSKKNNTAFFGFLGSADDQNSMNLQNVFDTLNKDTEYNWENWLKEKHQELKEKNLETISLNYYQGPSHQDKPSDPINAFWNDKSISWQQNIFTWVYSRANNDNPDYKTPTVPDGSGITPIESQKDDNGKDMFKTLPIIFIISKGKLITAAQNWPQNDNIIVQYEYVTQFVLANLLQ